MRGRSEFRGGYAEGVLALGAGAIGFLAVGMTSTAAVILALVACRHLPRTAAWEGRSPPGRRQAVCGLLLGLVALAFWTWFLLSFEAEPRANDGDAGGIGTSFLSFALIWGAVALATCLGLLLAWQRRRKPVVVEEP